MSSKMVSPCGNPRHLTLPANTNSLSSLSLAVAGWASQEAESEMELRVQGIDWGVTLGSTPKEGKGRKKEEGAGGEVGPGCRSSDSLGAHPRAALKLEWPVRVVPGLAEMAGPFYASICHQFASEGAWLLPTLQPRPSLKWPTAESHLQEALLAVGATSPSLKESLDSTSACPPHLRSVQCKDRAVRFQVPCTHGDYLPCGIQRYSIHF